MSSLPAPALVAIFAGSASAIWLAGVRLSKTTDALDARLGLGDDIGGLVLLGIATSLPEVAITVSAAIAGHIDLAIGNLIGGIAIQTVVLAALDARLLRRRVPLLVAGPLARRDRPPARQRSGGALPGAPRAPADRAGLARG